MAQLLKLLLGIDIKDREDRQNAALAETYKRADAVEANSEQERWRSHRARDVLTQLYARMENHARSIH